MPGDIPEHIMPDLEPDFVYLASVIAAQLRRGVPEPPRPNRTYMAVTHPTFTEHLEGPVVSSMQVTEDGILRVAARARIREWPVARPRPRRRASRPPSQPTLLEDESDGTDQDLPELQQPDQPEQQVQPHQPTREQAGQSLDSEGESASPSSESGDSQPSQSGAVATAAEQQQQPATPTPPTDSTPPATEGGGQAPPNAKRQRRRA